MRRIALFFTLILSMAASARAEGSAVPHELFGFLLRQSPEAFERTLGAPFKDGVREDGAHYWAYAIPGTKEDYLVVYFRPMTNMPDRLLATTLELTGTEYKGPTGFFGLHLGDSAAMVTAKLGKPSSVKHEDDVNVDLWDWPEKNYSLEMTPAGKVYSFQIADPLSPFPVKIPDGIALVKEFVLAARQRPRSKGVEEMMSSLSGDAFCSSKQWTGFSENAARTALKEINSPVSLCLTRMVAALEHVNFDHAWQDIRIYEDKAPSTIVVKFPVGCSLREVVLNWEVGAWRVYEITFSDAPFTAIDGRIRRRSI
ncbi:hypothetical protein SAMN05421770_10162 [Granulicella rosea]|uniref:Uncharacterized protein n=1 Tax=Granulicella rosea TaxID=474952 RepID=A0A239CSL2_9BACT|nr:hypothetical protein [Granulicella rosea]SNS22504.1 hypothetical protein SAMN05421770_10162 [Granulicella rosea]